MEAGGKLASDYKESEAERAARLSSCPGSWNRSSFEGYATGLIHTFATGAAVGAVHASLVLGRPDEHRVVGVGLDVLLQILGTLEGLAAELALVGLERNMNADVRGDVVALDGSGPARVPLAGEVQVVGALAADMALTQMLLW